MAVTASESDPLPQLEELVDAAREEAQAVAQHADTLQVIGFFDLSWSTRAKLTYGNAMASQEALTFTSLAGSISARLGGRALKTLGDGALAAFSDPLAACRAALNLRCRLRIRRQPFMIALGLLARYSV